MVLPLEKSQRPYRVLKVNELEDTTVIPKIDKDELEKTLMLPKMNLDEGSQKTDIAAPAKETENEKSDYLKQNIFSSVK